jgi:hypothetical protein
MGAGVKGHDAISLRRDFERFLEPASSAAPQASLERGRGQSDPPRERWREPGSANFHFGRTFALRVCCGCEWDEIGASDATGRIHFVFGFTFP